MKNVTFMIGNGFDVGMGMRVQYRDFYEYYTDPTSEYYPKKDKMLAGLAQSINADKAHWSYYEKILGQYALGFSGKPKSVQEYYVRQHDHFQSRFYEYLAEQAKKLDISGQKTLVGKTMRKAIQSFYAKEHVGSDAEQAVLDVLKGEACRYTFLCFNYSDVLDQCVAAVSGHRIDEQTTADGKTHVRSYKEIPSKTAGDGTPDQLHLSVCHVHGSLKERETNPNHHLVMGVNDASQICSADMAGKDSVCAALIKERISNSQFYENGKVLLKDSDVIVVYGMSVGCTDRCWWDLVVEWLLANEQRQLVIFVYDSAYHSLEHHRETELRREWLEKLTDSDAVRKAVKELEDSGREFPDQRIHFAIQKNIFQMDLRIK